MSKPTVVLSLLAGALASRVLEPWIFPAEIAGFRVHFGHLALVVLSVAAAALYRSAPTAVFWSTLGASLDQLVFLIIAAGGAAAYFGAPSVGGAAVLLLAAALTAGLIPAGRSGIPAGARVPWRSRVLAVAGMTLTVLAFRGSLAVMAAAGIADHDRSTVVAGHDIHHLNFGIVLIWFAAIGLRSTATGVRRIALLALAPGLGMLIDQLGYYALADVSDATYFGAASTVTAAAGLALAAAVILWPQRDGAASG